MPDHISKRALLVALFRPSREEKASVAATELCSDEDYDDSIDVTSNPEYDRKDWRDSGSSVTSSNRERVMSDSHVRPKSKKGNRISKREVVSPNGTESADLSAKMEPAPGIEAMSARSSKLNVVLLAQNALRTELHMFCTIVRSIESRKDELQSSDIGKLKQWTEVFLTFMHKFFSVEATVLYPALESRPLGPLQGHIGPKKRQLVRTSCEQCAQEIGDWMSRAESAPMEDVLEFFGMLRKSMHKLSFLLKGYFERQTNCLRDEIDRRMAWDQVPILLGQTLKGFSANPHRKTHPLILLRWTNYNSEVQTWLAQMLPKSSTVLRQASTDEHILLGEYITRRAVGSLK